MKRTKDRLLETLFDYCDFCCKSKASEELTLRPGHGEYADQYICQQCLGDHERDVN